MIRKQVIADLELQDLDHEVQFKITRRDYDYNIVTNWINENCSGKWGIEYIGDDKNGKSRNYSQYKSPTCGLVSYRSPLSNTLHVNIIIIFRFELQSDAALFILFRDIL